MSHSSVQNNLVVVQNGITKLNVSLPEEEDSVSAPLDPIGDVIDELVLGQRQDSLRDEKVSFAGEISHFYLWSRSLSEKEMKRVTMMTSGKITDCKGSDTGRDGQKLGG